MQIKRDLFTVVESEVVNFSCLLRDRKFVDVWSRDIQNNGSTRTLSTTVNHRPPQYSWLLAAVRCCLQCGIHIFPKCDHCDWFSCYAVAKFIAL